MSHREEIVRPLEKPSQVDSGVLIWRAKIVGSGAAEVSAQRLDWDGTTLVQAGKTIRIFPCPTDLGKILDVGDQVWICWKSDAQRWEILSHCVEATQALATVDEVVAANPTFDAENACPF